MWIKLKFFLFLPPLIIVSAIAFICLDAANMTRGFLLAYPKAVTAGEGVSIKRLEELNGEGLLLTYENVYDISVWAAAPYHGVVVKGTNASYPYVFGYKITSGGFFSETSFDSADKVAVLNEKAAFDMFGSFDVSGCEMRIDGERYVILGVLDDNEDSDNGSVFIPATRLSETAQTVFARLDGEGSAALQYVRGELKQAGITDVNYGFFNVESAVSIINSNLLAAAQIILLGLLPPAVKRLASSVKTRFGALLHISRKYYFTDILKNDKKAVLAIASSLALMSAALVLGFALAFNLFERFLDYNSAKNLYDAFNYSGAAENASGVLRLFFLSNILILGLTASVAVFTAVSLISYMAD